MEITDGVSHRDDVFVPIVVTLSRWPPGCVVWFLTNADGGDGPQDQS